MHKRFPICQTYYINTSPLQQVDKVHDLGVSLMQMSYVIYIWGLCAASSLWMMVSGNADI